LIDLTEVGDGIDEEPSRHAKKVTVDEIGMSYHYSKFTKGSRVSFDEIVFRERERENELRFTPNNLNPSVTQS
jgi:hypothetical protein